MLNAGLNGWMCLALMTFFSSATFFFLARFSTAIAAADAAAAGAEAEAELAPVEPFPFGVDTLYSISR
jgi:hypothetical protein